MTAPARRGRRTRGSRSSIAPVAAPIPVPPPPPPPPPRAPAFWFAFSIPWAKLAATRIVFFTLLAIDALLQIRHAPRYGAGGFGVAQVALLDGLGPTRTLYLLAQLVNAYLFILVACNVATRFALPVATALYAWLYFGSQLDSYQHHYLVAMLLVVACGVPWRRPEGVTPATPIASWAIRLILVELAILYLWAAISKLTPGWLDGSALATQLHDTMLAVATRIGLGRTAWLVVAVELTLAATVWWRRAWPLATVLGLGLHLGIVFTGLEIGLFAWLMIALYLLILPDRWILAVLGWTRGGWRNAIGDRLAGSGRWFVLVGAILAGDALAVACRFEHALGVASMLIIVPISVVVGRAAGGRLPRVAWVGVVHVLALTTWVAVDRASTVAFDYYNLWGGSSRRLGDTASAARAYAGMIRLDPDEPLGHFRRGRVLLEAGDVAGLDELHEAERLEPARARAFVEEARWLAAKGQPEQALAKAREATFAEPGSAEAQALVTALTAGKPAPRVRARADGDAEP
jgi:hypothetical protein